jgi:HlyD family secretion protein
MKKQTLIKKILMWMKENRKISILILIIILGIVYGIYKYYFSSVSIPQYTLSTVRNGSIIQVVTGSGQVSASNQTDIQSQVSGTIKTINASVGQSVKAGDLIATIDATNAMITLENARLSLSKLTQPAKETDVIVAKNNLSKAYESGFNSVSQVFLNLPTIMSGMKDLLYSQTGYLSYQGSSFSSPTSKEYVNTASKAYDLAVEKYKQSLIEYKTMSRSSPTSDLDKLLADTYETIKSVSEASTKAQNAINFIRSNEYSSQSGTAGETALTNVTTWANQSNSDVSNIVSAQNSILNSNNTLINLINGSDALDIQSAKLSLEQAQRTYDNYFIRAPYDGIIGRIPVNTYGQAGSGTVIATIVGQQKISNISLNEVDAAKVKIGQSVKITFDAIENLNATGTVSVVDQVATVSSGVVSYNVRITIDTEDERIRPGMSLNATIITLQKDNVITIPNSAVKKTGNQNYVQTFDKSLVQSLVPQTASSTRPTSTFGFNRTVTISTTNVPTKKNIVTGDSDDSNTEIIEGVDKGQFVVTKTSSATTAVTTTAPSILSGIGGRAPGTNATRTTTTR